MMCHHHHEMAWDCLWWPPDDIRGGCPIPLTQGLARVRNPLATAPPSWRLAPYIWSFVHLVWRRERETPYNASCCVNSSLTVWSTTIWNMKLACPVAFYHSYSQPLLLLVWAFLLPPWNTHSHTLLSAFAPAGLDYRAASSNIPRKFTRWAGSTKSPVMNSTLHMRF